MVCCVVCLQLTGMHGKLCFVECMQLIDIARAVTKAQQEGLQFPNVLFVLFVGGWACPQSPADLQTYPQLQIADMWQHCFSVWNAIRPLCMDCKSNCRNCAYW
jgi:hypothetical protein